MALLGHTIVEAGLARLSGLWPQTMRTNRLRLRGAPIRKPDQAALNAATALYSGETLLNVESFTDLSWLPHFAGSGRQLLMCHALSLLEGWNTQRPLKRSLQQEADVILRLARSAGAFAASMDQAAIEPLCLALQSSIHAFLTLRAHDPHELLTKAITLIEVSRVIEDGAALTREAARNLNHALPLLVAHDGGPTRHALQDYVRWVSLLLDVDDIPLHPVSRNALDRARPFLSMLVQHDLAYCFNPTEKIHPAILATTPMHLAPTSGVIRLSAGKSVVINLPHQLNTKASLHLSSHTHWLLDAGHFLHDVNDNHEQTFLSSSSGTEGTLLQQVTEVTERTVYLAKNGDDMRIEDIVPLDGLTRWMRLSVNPEAKLSIARNGTSASLALDGRNLWQLTLRGARLLPVQQNGEVWVETVSNPARINWALRRIARSSARGPKTEMPELPF